MAVEIFSCSNPHQSNVGINLGVTCIQRSIASNPATVPGKISMSLAIMKDDVSFLTKFILC